jgi:SPP1 gp7 family putative phage head morphogenesis protein
MNYDEFWELQIERIWRNYLDKYFEKLRGKSRLSMVISNPSIEISLDHYDPWISGFLTEYMFKEVKLTSSTARLQVGGIFDRWIATGKPFDWLVDQLVATNLFDKTRARRIAMTESTRIYAENNLAVWRQSEIVNKKRWYTAVDEKVCPICGVLDGKEVGLDEEFAPGILAPPAHVNCRCIIRPVISETLQQLQEEVKLDHWEQLLADNPYLNRKYWDEDKIRAEFGGKNVSKDEVISLKEWRIFQQIFGVLKNDVKICADPSKVKDRLAKDLQEILQKWGFPLDYYGISTIISSWALDSNYSFLPSLIQKRASEIFQSRFTPFQQSLHKIFWGEKSLSDWWEKILENIDAKAKKGRWKPEASVLNFDKYNWAEIKWDLEEGISKKLKIDTILSMGLNKTETYFYSPNMFGFKEKIEEILKTIASNLETNGVKTVGDVIELFKKEFTAWTFSNEKYMLQFLMAMYENTQNTIYQIIKSNEKWKNVKYLQLYRGINLYGVPDEQYPVQGTWIDYTMGNALESWSLNLETSKKFGRLVFRAYVPISRIVGSCLTGFGCLNEEEFVVMGTQIDKVYVQFSPNKGGKKKSFVPFLDNEYWGLLPNGKFVFMDSIHNANWLKQSGESLKEIQEWAKWYEENNAEA